MSKRKAATIPLESLLDDAEFGRNLKLEVRSSRANPRLVEALLDMTLANALTGRAFTKGRKPGTGGPIRLAIAKRLQADSTKKNAELWEDIGRKPPKGYQFQDNRLGKYIAVPKPGDDMSYRRFSNVAAEERGKLKGS